METLLRTLKLTDQDSSGPCHIITAVTQRAASAAADLLSSGDYAIAYPHSAILYHGMRTQESNPLTVESTSVLARILRRSNDRYALELARKIDDRFSFRFLFARNNFDEVRTKHPNQQLSDLQCFIEFIDGKLSKEARKVWQRAKERHGRYKELFTTVVKRVKGEIAKMSVAQAEAAAIKAIVEFEVKANKGDPDWSFRGGGLERLTDDFLLFHEYLTGFASGRLQEWSADWGKFIVAPEIAKEIDAIADEKERSKKLNETVGPLLEPLTSFFAAFCHALQEGENELTATDAYWLGLVDEVVGEDDLLCLRHMEEDKPDPVPTENAEKEAKQSEEVTAAGA
jgi:ATP-dependent protease ClpP protease subunit